MNANKIKLTPLLDTLYLGKLEDAVYFSPKYSEYISNSRLGLLKQQGAKAFIDGLAAQKGFNPSFFLGDLVHSLTLQSDLFELAPDLNRPTAKMGGMADYLYKSFVKNEIVPDNDIYKASEEVNYYLGKMNEERCDLVRGSCIDYWQARKQFESSYTTNKTIKYADIKTMETTLGCVNALHNNTMITEILHPKDSLDQDVISENEQAILLDVQVDIAGEEPFIVHLKAKLDNYTINIHDNIITINDVKTSIKDTRLFNEVIDTYSYYRELSWYAFLLNLCCERYYKMHNPIIKGNFLVVSTIAPYYTRVCPMDVNLFRKGIKEYKDLLKQACYYMKYGYDE